MKIIVTEVLNLINGIRTQPASIFEMIRADVKESVTQYLSGLMVPELGHFWSRARYQQSASRTRLGLALQILHNLIDSTVPACPG